MTAARKYPETSPAATRRPTPKLDTRRGSKTTPDANACAMPSKTPRPGSDLPPGQDASDPQSQTAGWDLLIQPTASVGPAPRHQSRLVGQVEQRDQLRRVAQPLAVSLFDPSLLVLAEAVDGFEDLRKASANRLRILTRDEADSDGEERGFKLPDNHPAVVALAAQLAALEALEHGATLALKRQFRTHPLHPWVKQQNGLGEKTIARLLSSISDPYWNTLHDRPRTVGELFAYCGVSGPGQRRRRLTQEQKDAGERGVTWNATARMRLWIIVGPIIRGTGPYRDIYNAGREKYADKTHTVACAQCGSKGKPADIDTPWRDGHKHAGAIRLVMREILRDLWTEAKRIHEANDPT